MTNKESKLTETRTPKEKLTELYDWSLNFEKDNPFSVYCDLVGYSHERYGSTLVTNLNKCLGYAELTMLSNCLALFENNGYDTIYNIIDEILEERNE
tara:strand:+ start:1881 stop:2171 length:291 start_codon:yes stop_codon:yes gene_type:complete